jgi:hypothetical protein
MFELAVSSGHPLRFFLEPVAVSLNALKPRYKEIHMAGLSGGGWTTTLYAAIDPQIHGSFPVAGTVPLQFRNRNTVGDKEQHLEEFYKVANYLDLYLLGSYGAGRKQIQILNRRDDCCFGEAQHRTQAGLDYVSAIRAYEKQVQRALGSQGRFRVDIDETASHHMISAEAVRTIVREMGHSQR